MALIMSYVASNIFQSHIGGEYSANLEDVLENDFMSTKREGVLQHCANVYYGILFKYFKNIKISTKNQGVL